ncbi:histidine phosphatase family protein [Modestobacter sp. VKM Ac-2986]|uniref:histidine phosphatase family protein n=1 Tax=Modestobacter sp. VKM Ac-2986 TaxID=3004140 RepID=UPI0022AA4AAC|nr:histidine phosphatase family protein [Modestobacter sp. VKM Ac-2986]MCZ2827527.1 histidine phosphatase family protein [Modestobacter sp. VKM Ac-2986]
MRLVLVRHGQTTSNLVHALDTAEPGAELTALGQQQAAALVGDLAAEEVDVLAASPLRRAQQTAAPLAAAHGLTVLTLPGLREIGAGDLEMQQGPEAVARYLDVAFSWVGHDSPERLPGGPAGVEVLAGFDAAVSALEGHGTAVAVSHGAVIRVWLAARARGLTLAGVRDRPLANTGVVVLEGSTADGWELQGWHERSGAEQPLTGTGDAGGAPRDALGQEPPPGH